MKKAKNRLATDSLRVYLTAVRRRLLGNYLLPFLLCAAAVAPLQAAGIAHFLVLADGTHLLTAVATLEQEGGRVQKRVPPAVLIVELPGPVPPGVPTRLATTGAVPLALLKDLGGAAVAAGLHWNKALLSRPRDPRQPGIAALQAQAMQQLLPAPVLRDPESRNHAIRCVWDEVDGALFYHLEAATTADFRAPTVQTRTEALAALIPASNAASEQTWHIRVRAADRHNPESADGDVFGAWSTPRQITLQVEDTRETTPPRPLTPPDGHQTNGFLTILEWERSGSDTVHVQAALSRDFSRPLVDELTHGDVFILPASALHVGEHIFWRIRHAGPNQSPWSETRQVTVAAPRAIPNDMMINPEAPR